MIWCFIVVLVKETDAAQDGLFAPVDIPVR